MVGTISKPQGSSGATCGRSIGEQSGRTAGNRLGPGPHGLAFDRGAACPLPELLTPSDVARWLKTSVRAVYAKAERGTLPGATRIGRRLYFLRADLLRLVEQGRVPHLGDPGDDT